MGKRLDTSSVTIKELTLNNLDAYVLHYVNLVYELDKILMSDRPNMINKVSVEYVSSLLVNKRVFFVMESDIPIGFITIRVVGEELEKFIYVNEIFVVDKHRNSGYGKRLVDHVIWLSKINNINNVYLNVSCCNTHAIDFYNKLGFKVKFHTMELKL